MFRALAGRNYRIWAAGAAISNIGTWMQRTAQDWLVLSELSRHDATSVGIVMALQFAPQFIFLPWIGLVADRLDRRHLLMMTQGAMGVLAGMLGVLVLAGVVRLWEVELFAFLSGTVGAFDGPARQIFVNDLVGEADLGNAVALNSASFNAARMIGPAVAGLSIAAVGSGWSFMANGVSFFAVLAALACIRARDLHVAPRAGRGTRGLLDGVRYVGMRADLRAVMVILAVVGTFGLDFQIYIATMTVSVFHLGAAHFGVLNSAMAVGTIAGALLAGRRADVTLATLGMGSGLFAVGCAGAALAPDYGLFAASLAFAGLAAQTLTTGSNSFVQMATAPGMRGRVMAIRLAVALGGVPIGAPVAGLIADHWGPRFSLGLAALSGVAGALIGRYYRQRIAAAPQT